MNANRWSVELYNNFGEFWNIYTILAPTKEQAEAKALADHSHLNGGGWKICSCNPIPNKVTDCLDDRDYPADWF